MQMTRIALTAALLAGSALAAQAQALPDRVKTAGKIVIATFPNYAPITYKDPATNQLVGFDIELGEAIAKELGVKVEWQETAFEQMLSSLQTGRADTVLVGMGDLPSRHDRVDFVDYMVSGAQFFTVTPFKDAISTVEDLCGKNVGASRTTAWPQQLADWSELNCVAKGKPALNVVGTEGSVETRMELKTQRLQGGVQGSEVMKYYMKLEPNTFIPLGKPITRMFVGMPFAKTAEGNQLRDAVKGALERLQANGTYDQLIAKYELAENVLKPITINQGGEPQK